MVENVTVENIIKSGIKCPSCNTNKYLVPYSVKKERKYVLCKECWVYYNYYDLIQSDKNEGE